MSEPARPGAGLDRRRLLALAGGALGVGALGAPSPALSRGLSRSDPFSMAMHLHGSFSEGKASMHAHLHQAERLGVDIVWWTDHDFRQSAYGYRKAVGFDGDRELEDGKSWTWTETSAGPDLTRSTHAFVADPTSPDEPGLAMRLDATAAGGPRWSTYLLEGVAWNFTYSTSYIDTTLTLDVLGERLGPDAHLLVEIGSSYRPATAGRPAGEYRLQYRLGGGIGRWTEDSGRLGVIGIPAAGGTTWQRLRLDPCADHAALWPDTVAGDASLKYFRVGVRARNGATATAVVDRLRFHRERKTPADGSELLLSVVREYRDRYPGITQHAAAEISLVDHLNAFGGDGVLPTYTDPSLIKDESLQAQLAMVRFLHRHGAVVSINHPSPGPRGTEQLARRLVSTSGLGADVIEIGTTRSIESLIRQYDIAARNAVFLTACGTTDNHDGIDWLGEIYPRWLTGVWAGDRSVRSTCTALLAGRAWFYDPLKWSGELDLRIDGHVPMGGVLLTRHDLVDLTITATALPAGGSLELVVGRCDRAGLSALEPANRSRVVPAGQVTGGRWSTQVRRRSGVYVRAMVRTAAGAVVGFSNPVWVLPARLKGRVPVPGQRRYVDV